MLLGMPWPSEPAINANRELRATRAANLGGAMQGPCHRPQRDADVLRPYSPVHPDDETFDELLITNDIYELVEYKAAPWMPIRPRPPPTPPPPPVDRLACPTAP